MNVTLNNNSQSFKSRVIAIFMIKQSAPSLPYYSQVKPDFNLDKVERIICNRGFSLPRTMTTFFATPLAYMRKHLNTKEMVNQYFEYLPDFYERVNLAEDSALFRQNYRQEILSIQKMANSISNYLGHRTSKMAMDASLEKHLTDYTKQPFDKKLFFLF